MPKKLPENIDQIEDFYKSSLSNDTELPPSDLWEKLEQRIEASSPDLVHEPNVKFWKQGWVKWMLGAAVSLSVVYFLYPTPQDVREESALPVTKEPLGKEAPQSVLQKQTDSILEPIGDTRVALPTKPIGNKPVLQENGTEEDRTVDSSVRKISQEVMEAELQKVSQEEETENGSVVAPNNDKKTENLYSRLKKKLGKDSSKSLFIEKK